MLNCKCYHCKMQDVDGVSVFEFTIIVRCTVEQKKDAIEKVHCIPIKSGSSTLPPRMTCSFSSSTALQRWFFRRERSARADACMSAGLHEVTTAMVTNMRGEQRGARRVREDYLH